MHPKLLANKSWLCCFSRLAGYFSLTESAGCVIVPRFVFVGRTGAQPDRLCCRMGYMAALHCVCMSQCAFAHQRQLLVYVLQHLPLPQRKLVLPPGLSLFQLGCEDRKRQICEKEEEDV